MVVAKVLIWKHLVGAVLWDSEKNCARFEFDPDFIKKGLDLAPLQMPLDEALMGKRIFSFPELSKVTYKGLPGLLADSLPDKFGNKLIDAWLSRQGRNPSSVTAVERLCYIGKRGMGALEFEPTNYLSDIQSHPLEIEELVKLARELLNEKQKLKSNIHKKNSDALMEIISVGTSAGGARAKAIIAYNEKSGEVRSGQIAAASDFSYWIIKFDGVTNDQLGDPKGYGKIEYAYHKMAIDAGITMTDCRLLKEKDRAHFMTKRFDRIGNKKLHLQTLCAIAHFDYNDPEAYSYEQAFQVMRQLRLPYADAEQLFLRMAFNVVARNQDDHTKNISFLMDDTGIWRLSPAYDVTYAHSPENKWMRKHQLSINGKSENIQREDLLKVAKEMNIKKADELIEQVIAGVRHWKKYAKEVEIPLSQLKAIEQAHNFLK